MISEKDYSIPKSELDPEVFDKLLEGFEIRASIAQNVKAAIGAEAIQQKQGIFALEDFTKHFTFDGSLKSKRDPIQSAHYGEFFSREGRLSKKGNDYIFRGANYLVSIDPTLEVRQKLDLLASDFVDAVDALSLDGASFSQENYVEQSAVLDYLKNAAVTIFNALIQEEKIGKFHLDDKEYQQIRLFAIQLARYATQAYYAHLMGREDDYTLAMTMLIEQYEKMQLVIEYIEREYREGVFSSRHFTRPEAGHPLVIAASAFTAVKNVDPLPDTVIGLPSGGTELAFAQQYAYGALRQHYPEFVLIPLSLHSIKDAFGDDKKVDKGGFKDFLRSREKLLQGKKILIVEDNSSTGRTIQELHDMLIELFATQTVNVSVAEADLIRSSINSEAKHRTHVATGRVYTHSVGILPISKKIHPKVDLKEIAETRRLASEYRRKLEKATTPAEQLMFRAFIRMCERPTEDILETLDNTNSIRSFRETFLSNFYAVSVTYAGQQYPSVEYAYQAQKFTPKTLRSISRQCLAELNEIMRTKGRLANLEDASSIFKDHTLFSGVVKVIADTLRKYGYVRDSWDDDKMLLMADLLLQKYKNPELADRLLGTGEKYLVEGNTWNDTLWGVSNGRGRNLLGLMLMEIRKSLQENRKKS